MNCHDFESIVPELLNGEAGDSKRLEGFAHASTCGQCGALLEAERSLSADMRLLAAEQLSEEVPPRVEQQLLTAFRAHFQAGRAASGNVAGERARPASRWFLSGARRNLSANWRLWGAAAAGLALAGFALHSFLSRPDLTPAKFAPPLAVTAQAPQAREAGTPPSTLRGAAPARVAEHRAASRPQRPRRETRGMAGRAEALRAEITTSFYAIPYVEPALPGETLRVVRTRVPRSSLASIGFPVNGDRALEPLQADVLVGDDNVARAIRFVEQLQLPQAIPGTARSTPVNVKYER